MNGSDDALRFGGVEEGVNMELLMLAPLAERSRCKGLHFPLKDCVTLQFIVAFTSWRRIANAFTSGKQSNSFGLLMFCTPQAWGKSIGLLVCIPLRATTV